MGGCCSCRSSSKFNNVRVVHLSGYMEYFDYPVTVSEVTGNPPKHFVCTSTELLSIRSKPLKSDAELQPGNIYFMLPFSSLQADVSPANWASVVKKLTAIAKTSRGVPRCKASPLLRSSSSPMSSANTSRYGESEQSFMAYEGTRSCKGQSWKPILDTIRERSFNQKSESDLQEHR